MEKSQPTSICENIIKIIGKITQNNYNFMMQRKYLKNARYARS
ncbi:MAG: hypothetical protein UZ09_BCD002002174 [Bacteroidetes bacterium OLB9]|nr:MAG: hypothetical protein UZ09_BCD002002174 [Bacteroidetes bacterium OLB9]